MRKYDRFYLRIIRDSKHNDKARGRKIRPNVQYITSDYIQELQNNQENKCYYCLKSMNWLKRAGKDGLTCARTLNNFAHYKFNVDKLCCKSCNSKDFSVQRGLLKRCFSKWKENTFKIVSPVEDRSACFHC